MKNFSAFDKKRHSLPDAVNAATQGFLAKLCAEELAEEAEAFFRRARDVFAYKRREISLGVSSPSAVLETRDFTFEIFYELDPRAPENFIVTRSLHGIRSGDLVFTEEFNELFAAQFSGIVFELKKGVRVDAVVDAIEAVGDGSLSVDYPSDCSVCTVAVAGVDAELVCDGASLEMRFTRSGSPAELLREFEKVRAAFALSKMEALAGLVG